MKTFAEAETVLAAALPGYEARTQQQTLARAVEAVFANPDNFTPIRLDEPTNRKHLFGQAGTGCGKSLGYLIPAILSGRRTMISVTTKALQDQLTGKDLPFLEKYLGVPFTLCSLKGRANYFCSTKAAEADESEVLGLADIMRQASEPGFSGLRDDFSREFSAKEWALLCADADDCKANDCKDRGGCFAEDARTRAKACRIVVINHALFFTDLMIKGLWDTSTGMLDEYDAVVLDESHEAAAIAGEAMGGTFSEGSIRSLTGNIRSWMAKSSTEGEGTVSAEIADLLAASATLFKALPGGEGQTKRLVAADLDKLADELGGVYDSLKTLAAKFAASKISPDVDYTKAKARKDRIRRQGNGTYSRLIEIITTDFASLVRWVEIESKIFKGRTEQRKVIKVAPVDVAPFLREALFSQTPVIMVSATLAVKGQFEFAATQLGVDNYTGIDVGSPFNFTSQARLYVPKHLPEPKGANVAVWETMVIEEIVDLIKASQGRALVLFTSLKQMRAAYESVNRRVPFTVKMQGQESPKDLSAWFAKETHGVLFGSKSFFTGVDIQGESLVNVIVSKMPFPVPTEPLTEARCDAIEARGGNAFSEYTMPVMSLILQQAVGRLIRHTNDRGVVSILDPRIRTKAYGKSILRDLPPLPVVTEIGAVQDFFATVNTHFGTKETAAPPAALAL